MYRLCTKSNQKRGRKIHETGCFAIGQQLVAQINLMMASCVLNTSWGTFELESATD